MLQHGVGTKEEFHGSTKFRKSTIFLRSIRLAVNPNCARASNHNATLRFSVEGSVTKPTTLPEPNKVHSSTAAHSFPGLH
eukprot:558809-Amphidinium_carterae.2